MSLPESHPPEAGADLHLFQPPPGGGDPPSPPPRPPTRRRRRQKAPNFLDRDETRRLLAECHRQLDTARTRGQRFRATRNLLMVSLGVTVGPRVSELIGFRVRDVNLNDRSLFVSEGKTGDRYLPIPGHLFADLTAWIKGGHPEAIWLEADGGEAWLFPGPKGKQFTRQTFHGWLRKAAKAAGIAKLVKPHTLRHTAATLLLRGGKDIETVRDLLGHSSIRTTAIYLHSDTETKRRAVDDVWQGGL